MPVTSKKSSDFHSGIRFQSSFTIRWELEDKNFLKIDIIWLDDSLKYRIMAIKTNKNFIPFPNSVTFRKPWRTYLVTASELIPGFCRSKSNVISYPDPTLFYTEKWLRQMSRPRGSFARSKARHAGRIVSGIKCPPLARTPPPPGGIYIDRCITEDFEAFFRTVCFLNWISEIKTTSFCWLQKDNA